MFTSGSVQSPRLRLVRWRSAQVMATIHPTLLPPVTRLMTFVTL